MAKIKKKIEILYNKNNIIISEKDTNYEILSVKIN